MIEEIWKPMKNTKGLFFISNFGRIKIKEHYKDYSKYGRGIIKVDEHFLKLRNTSWGFLGFCKNRKTYKIHHLVYHYFGSRFDKQQDLIVHKDGDKSNNRIDNLLKVNKAYFTKLRHLSGSLNNRGMRSHTCISRMKDIIQVKKLLKTNRYSATQIEKITGVKKSVILSVSAGVSWKWLDNEKYVEL